MVITPLVLCGRLVTMDEKKPVVEDGALYIGSVDDPDPFDLDRDGDGMGCEF